MAHRAPERVFQRVSRLGLQCSVRLPPPSPSWRQPTRRGREKLRCSELAAVSKMALLWTVMSFAFSLLLTPFLMLLLAIIFLASIGKSLGVRRLYIKLLLALFEVSVAGASLVSYPWDSTGTLPDDHFLRTSRFSSIGSSPRLVWSLFSSPLHSSRWKRLFPVHIGIFFCGTCIGGNADRAVSRVFVPWFRKMLTFAADFPADGRIGSLLSFFGLIRYSGKWISGDLRQREYHVRRVGGFLRFVAS